MSPQIFHLNDPTEASKQVLRRGLNRASMIRKRASHLGKRASVAARILNPRPTLFITDINGRNALVEPEHKYWNRSVIEVQQVQIFGEDDHVRVRQDTRHMQFYVNNVSKEPSTALYSNPEYARSSVRLSLLSTQEDFEDFEDFEGFDGAYAIVTNSESSSIATLPGNFEVDVASSRGTVSRWSSSTTSISSMSSVQSLTECAAGCATDPTTIPIETTTSSHRSSFTSLPDISNSPPVLPDFSTDFEPFEVRFPRDRTSIKIPFTLVSQTDSTPAIPSPLPPVLQPGTVARPETVEDPPTPELPPTDHLPVMPLIAPFDPYNEAYKPNPAGRYSVARWAPNNNPGRNTLRPHTVGDFSTLSTPSTPQFKEGGVPHSTGELFLSPTPSPRRRPVTLATQPSTTYSIPRKPVPQPKAFIPRKPVPQPRAPIPAPASTSPTPEAVPLSSHIPQPNHAPPPPPNTHGTYTPQIHRSDLNFSSRYPRLEPNTNKPLPPQPAHALRHNASSKHQRARHTPLSHRAGWEQDEKPTEPTKPIKSTKPTEPEHLRESQQKFERPLSMTLSGAPSPKLSRLDKLKGAKVTKMLGKGLSKVFSAGNGGK